MQKIIAVLATLFCVRPCFARSYEYALDHGRRVPVGIQTTSATSDWLVFLQGSGCDYREIPDNRFVQNLLSTRAYNVLVISKAGVDLGGDEKKCREDEFQRSSVRSQRITDIHTIMNDLVPRGARILLSALSEGAYIAPDIALEDTRVQAYIDISGSTQSWMTEEIMCVPEGAKRDQLSNFFDTEVRGHDSFTKYYESWTYAYLNSYDTHRSYESMKRLQIPILWMNADHDEVLWVEGARSDAQKLIHEEGKTNIQYEWIQGAGHVMHCSDSAPGCDEDSLAAHVRSLMTTFAAAKF